MKEFRTYFTLKASDEGEGKRWVWLMAAATLEETSYGKMEITLEKLHQAVANFKRGGRTVVLDYDHALDMDDVAPQDRIASGEVFDMKVEGNALYGLVEWTARAKDGIKAGEWRYFSPAWSENAIDKYTGDHIGFTLVGGGLTNRPLFDRQPRVAASDAAGKNNKEKTVMEMKEILEALGLPEGGDALAEIRKIKDAETTRIASETKSLNEAKEQVVKLAAEKTALAAELKNRDAKLAEITKALHERRWTELRDKAMNAGKATAAEFTASEKGECAMKSLFDAAPDTVEKMILDRPDGYAVKLGEQGTGTKPSADSAEIKIASIMTEKKCSRAEAIRIAALLNPELFEGTVKKEGK